MLFRVWVSDLHRPTRDVDLLGQGDASPDAVAMAVREILSTAVSDDGLTFDPKSVAAEPIREDQEYGGIRVRVEAMLGSARIPMQIDVGFSDVIVPKAEKRAFPTLLDMAPPRVAMYPPETVVAEKLQAISVLGMANSRMKDFYDPLVISQRFEFEGSILSKAIEATFKRRSTSIPDALPLGLTGEFAEDRQKQQ